MSDEFACEKFGRKDLSYQNWRWKPHKCDLPSCVSLLSTSFPQKIIVGFLIITCVGEIRGAHLWITSHHIRRPDTTLRLRFMGLLLTYMVFNLFTSTRCGTSPHTCNPTHLPLKCESLPHGSLPLEWKSLSSTSIVMATCGTCLACQPFWSPRFTCRARCAISHSGHLRYLHTRLSRSPT